VSWSVICLQVLVALADLSQWWQGEKRPCTASKIMGVPKLMVVEFGLLT
jgi:hypothetical protein